MSIINIYIKYNIFIYVNTTKIYYIPYKVNKIIILMYLPKYDCKLTKGIDFDLWLL